MEQGEDWAPAYFILGTADGATIQYGHITNTSERGVCRIEYTDRDARQLVAHVVLTFATWLAARDYLIGEGEYTPVPTL